MGDINKQIERLIAHRESIESQINYLKGLKNKISFPVIKMSAFDFADRCELSVRAFNGLCRAMNRECWNAYVTEDDTFTQKALDFIATLGGDTLYECFMKCRCVGKKTAKELETAFKSIAYEDESEKNPKN